MRGSCFTGLGMKEEEKVVHSTFSLFVFAFYGVAFYLILKKLVYTFVLCAFFYFLNFFYRSMEKVARCFIDPLLA